MITCLHNGFLKQLELEGTQSKHYIIEYEVPVLLHNLRWGHFTNFDQTGFFKFVFVDFILYLIQHHPIEESNESNGHTIHDDVLRLSSLQDDHRDEGQTLHDPTQPDWKHARHYEYKVDE